MLFVRKECRKAAIVGLGGVGKTQVALQLAYWTKKHRPEFSIFWAPALSKATLEQAFTEMARNLPIQSGGDDDDLKVSVRRYLSSEAAGPWLLVVDNADDRDILFGSADMLGGISDYLPESDNGLTLFTTRSREVAVSVTGSDVIELNAMDQPEAAVFLEKSLIQKDMLRDEGATAELLKELTYLPLAISQAAAYINTKQVPLAEYVKLLHGTQQDIVSLMSKEFRDNTRYAGSQNAVATTWLISFDQIRKSDNAAADLLSFISCIEPKGIPQSLFPDSESTAQLVDAIGTLCSYAFLTRREDSKVFDMHGLVHLATRIWVQREGLTATTGKKAIRHIATVFPSDDYANRNVWREYLPHAFRVLQQSKELDIEERSELLFWVGRCLRVDGRIKEAVETLEEACQWRNRHLAEDHPSRLASQHALAIAYRANGQVKEAVVLLEQVVAIQAQTLAEDHPSRLASQHVLAIAYQANGQVKEAVALLEQVVAIKAKTLAEDHPDRLASQHALAGAYEANGQVKEAVALLEQVVAIREQVLAEDHPSRLASQQWLEYILEAADGDELDYNVSGSY
jgi:Tfp pilus assembly protein PilF